MKRITKILAVCMLVIMVAMTFTSCGLFSLNLEKVAKRLAKEDYIVIMSQNEDLLDSFAYEVVDIDDPEFLLVAISEDGNEAFVSIEFETFADAKDALDDFEKELEDDIEEENLILGRRGKVVYIGNEDIVKEALGFPANLLVDLF